MPSSYHARVAAIASSYEIVLNKGAADNVQLGDRYVVFALGQQIFDPETRSDLGQLEVVRGIGEVTHLQEKMCTLESRKSRSATQKKKSSYYLTEIFGVSSESGDTKATLAPWAEPEIGDYARKI